MKIQRGIVKYKDRNDIVCTYALTDDGLQYYFLDEEDTKKISNGNRIATTQLVEAIDPMVKASNVGVIDQNGVIIVPFENRSIRLANDNLLIVEKAVPTSPDVLEAIELRNDPTAAAKLVSTPAAIKDRLKAQMGVEGNYLFNDQFSEATICDVNGTNLVQGESFSFICMANDRLYLSKNTLDSPIAEFSLTTYEMSVSQPMEAPTDEIDVSAATVDPQVVEGALNAEAGVALPTGEVASDPIMPSIPVVPAEENPADVSIPTEEAPVEGMDASVSEAPVDVVSVPTEETPMEGVVASEEAATEEVPIEGMGDVTVTNDVENTNEPPKEDIVHEVIDVPEGEMTEDVSTEAENPTEEKEASNDFADDLKAFTGGIPAGEEAPVESDVPPIVEEENNDNITLPVTEEVKEDVVHEVIDDVNTEVSDVDLPPEEKQEEREEIFSPTVTSDREEEIDQENQNAPVNIDAETVFATVDRNQNGIIDSDEVMVPQHNDINTTSNTTLTDIFNTSTSAPTTDYGLPSSFDSSYKPNSTYESYDSLMTSAKPYDSYGPLESDHLMSDVARSMAELMKRNREQRNAISQYQSKIENLEAQSRMLSEKYKDQSMRVDALSSKLRTMEDAVTRMESKNQLLEKKVHDQDMIIASQDREIKILRPQVEGKQDLVRLLADARTMLGSDSGYGYDDGNNYYGGRVA